jgi:hypothetical protein
MIFFFVVTVRIITQMLFQVLFSDNTCICSARNEIDGIDGNDLNGKIYDNYFNMVTQPCNTS